MGGAAEDLRSRCGLHFAEFGRGPRGQFVVGRSLAARVAVVSWGRGRRGGSRHLARGRTATAAVAVTNARDGAPGRGREAALYLAQLPDLPPIFAVTSMP